MKNKIIAVVVLGLVLLNLLQWKLPESPKFAGVSDECENPDPAWVFCDGFESGDFSAWDTVIGNQEGFPPALTIGDGMLNIIYKNDDPNGQGYLRKDQNRFVQIDPATMTPHNLSHFFIRKEIKFAPSIGMESDQKKLYYIWGQNDAWHMVLKAEKPTGTHGSEPMKIKVVGSDLNHANGVGRVLQASTTLSHDQLYTLEWEVKLNSDPACDLTVNNCDGETRVWVDDVLVLETTGLKLRHTTSPLGRTRFGNQANDNVDLYDESRYIDNVVVSTEKIGLVKACN